MTIQSCRFCAAAGLVLMILIQSSQGEKGNLLEMSPHHTDDIVLRNYGIWSEVKIGGNFDWKVLNAADRNRYLSGSITAVFKDNEGKELEMSIGQEFLFLNFDEGYDFLQVAGTRIKGVPHRHITFLVVISKSAISNKHVITYYAMLCVDALAGPPTNHIIKRRADEQEQMIEWQNANTFVAVKLGVLSIVPDSSH